MIRHIDLGSTSFARLRMLAHLVQNGQISLGGHQPGKVYGLLNCRAGKRMNVKNRVFFPNKTEAIEQGYRPCSVCMPVAYKAWKESGK